MGLSYQKWSGPTPARDFRQTFLRLFSRGFAFQLAHSQQIYHISSLRTPILHIHAYTYTYENKASKVAVLRGRKREKHLERGSRINWELEAREPGRPSHLLLGANWFIAPEGPRVAPPALFCHSTCLPRASSTPLLCRARYICTASEIILR